VGSTKHASPVSALAARSRSVREIVARWRVLGRDAVGGDPARLGVTVVACSGGADSSALAVALRTATDRLVLAHVLHGMRERGEEEQDRDAARRLAERLAVGFEETRIGAAARENVEASLRRDRYAALRRIASETGAGLVVTGHHADDQWESMVLAMVRGAGVRGMAGVAAKRRLGGGVWLARPMLGVTRAEARALCELEGVAWREDATNGDVGRARARVRHGALVDLDALRPGAAKRAARSAAMLRDAAGLVEDRARAVFGDELAWDRGRLREERAIVVGAGLRRAALRLTRGVGADRLGERLVGPVVRAARDDRHDPRGFVWPIGVEVRVRSKRVEMSMVSGQVLSAAE